MRHFKMDIISSNKNSHIKEAKSLLQKKYRDLTNSFLVEGGNIFKDMPNDVKVKAVFCTTNRADEVNSLVACKNADIYYVSDNVMNYLSDTVTPYGIVAVVEKVTKSYRDPVGNALLLDKVSDPGNLGTIIRTAVAAGFLDIYLLNTVDIYSPKVVRATLGGLFKINIFEIDEEQAITLCKNTNSIALDMNGKNMLNECFDNDVLFVAGNEANGVSKKILESTGNVYSLPMKNGIESLNVAIATAIAMYKTI